LGYQFVKTINKNIGNASSKKEFSDKSLLIKKEIYGKEEFKDYQLSELDFEKQIHSMTGLFEKRSIKEVYQYNLYEKFKGFRNDLYHLVSKEQFDQARLLLANNLFKISFHSLSYLMFEFGDRVNLNPKTVDGNKEIILKKSTVHGINHGFEWLQEGRSKSSLLVQFIFQEARRIGVNDFEDVLIDNFYISKEKLNSDV